MKIILSRVNDAKKYSWKWVIGYALLFWLTTKILSVLLVSGCTVIYEQLGYDKGMFPEFGGVPQGLNNTGKLLYTLLKVGIIVPLLGELVFRLGLSFQKRQVALALACIPLYIGWAYDQTQTIISAILYVIAALVIYYIVEKSTKQEFWGSLKSKYLIPAMWITSIAFGLVQFHSFSFMTWALLPYALCMISSIFFLGCACAYLRVNLGFWCGVGLHVFNNIPGLLTILLMSMH